MGIHPFPKSELDDRIVRSYELNGPFPRPEGEVEILLGVADSLKLLKEEACFPEEVFCITVHSLWLCAMWKSTSKNFNRLQECVHPLG